MPKFTKYPEGCPVVFALSKIAAHHPWDVDGEMCVKIILVGGVEIHVSEDMREVSEQMPNSHSR